MTDYGVILHHAAGLIDPAAFHDQLRADPGLVDRLAFANEHGIPPSILAGRVWPNPLDPTEPQWLPDMDGPGDWTLVRAYRVWQRGACPQCGIHEQDWASDREQPFVAQARICHGCSEVLDAEKEHEGHPRARALRLSLVPFDPDEVAGGG